MPDRTQYSGFSFFTEKLANKLPYHRRLRCCSSSFPISSRRCPRHVDPKAAKNASRCSSHPSTAACCSPVSVRLRSQADDSINCRSGRQNTPPDGERSNSQACTGGCPSIRSLQFSEFRILLSQQLTMRAPASKARRISRPQLKLDTSLRRRSSRKNSPCRASLIRRRFQA